jgi:hypothetical protein
MNGKNMASNGDEQTTELLYILLMWTVTVTAQCNDAKK